MAIRVIIDKCAIQGEFLDLLVASNLNELIFHKKIEVNLTPILLEETLKSYSHNHRNRFEKELKFLLSIGENRIFRERKDIWYDELVKQQGSHARHYMNKKERELMLDLIRTGFNRAEDITYSKLLTEATPELEEISRKKRNQRRISSDIRADPVSKSIRQTFNTYEKFRDEHIRNCGTDLIQKQLEGCKKIGAKQRLWLKDMGKYPYFTAFTNGFCYYIYYAMDNEKGRLDENAQADYESLMYLNDADAIVSNDGRFLKSAFDAMWQGRGKRLLSTREWIEELQSM